MPKKLIRSEEKLKAIFDGYKHQTQLITVIGLEKHNSYLVFKNNYFKELYFILKNIILC